MTEHEFQSGMSRLMGQWGNAYGPDRVKLIARELRGLNASTWERLVDRLLGECRQPPLLPEIRDALARERERTATEPRPLTLVWSVTASCEYCWDLGVYLCSKKDAGGKWAFRCHCHKGLNHPSVNIPFYTAEKRDEGFVWVNPRKLKVSEPQAMPLGAE